MKSLVLYDLENVGSLNCARAPAHRQDADTVVVVGVSTGGLAKLGDEMRAPYCFATLLRDAGSAAARAYPKPASFALEIALTLAMPEAVDTALTRLVAEAGTEQTAGDFDDVVLISGDVDFAADVGEGLRQAGCHWERKEIEPEGWPRWRRGHLHGPLQRRFQPASAIRAASRDSTGPTAVLDDLARLREWSGTAAQVSASLPELALDVELRPEALTQIGVTRTSTRSLQRLVELSIAGHPTLAGASKDDGVEVVSTGALPAAGASVSIEDSSLPCGAVRIEWGHPTRTATVRTNLWRPLVQALSAGQVPRLKQHAVDDRALLAGTAPASAMTSVHFYRRDGDTVVCAVDSMPGRPPAVWWHFGTEKRPTAKHEIKTNRLMETRGSVTAVAAQAVVQRCAIALQAPEVMGPLKISAARQPQFVSAATDERGRGYAVLSLRRPLATNELVTSSRRIAQVPGPGPTGGPLARVWADLQRLPIMVVS